MHKRRFYEKFAKRPIDFILSFLTLVILFPVLFIVAVLVRLKLGAPIIFKQPRPGLNEKIFNLYKFRTMLNKKDENGHLLPDEVRLTKLGKFLRSTSLDELPSLVNILIGNLSIVGPRPLLVKYLQLYTEQERKRHVVRPGLTGLAQVNGRNLIKWEDKFKFDLLYIENITLLGDIKIILKTIKKIFIKEGISSIGSVSAEEYKGKNNE